MTDSQIMFLAFTILGGIMWIITYSMVKSERRLDIEMEYEEEEDISPDNSDQGDISDTSTDDVDKW